MDAVGAIDKKLGKQDRAFLVILTDGWENASETDSETVAKLIKQREEDGWAFLYLGANQNAVQAAGNIGLQSHHALKFNSSKKGVSFSDAWGESARSGLPRLKLQ